jgi:tyrosyl-tRNA synthetase
MSKTKGNGINLSDTSEDMFGKAMSYSDDHIISGLELLTEVPMEDIKKIEKDIEKGVNQMEHKKFMAYEIVKMIKGEKAAKSAQDYFEKTVQKKEIPSEVDYSPAPPGTALIDLIFKEGLAVSKSDAKRKIEQGGVEIDGKKVVDINAEITQEMDGKILKVGRREFRRIKIV